MTELHTQAISELQQQANNGDAQAQFELAYYYSKDDEIEKNNEMVFEWLGKSAEQGNSKSQLSLGFYYFLNPDREQTKLLLSKWAKQLGTREINIPLDIAVNLAGKGDFKVYDDNRAFVWLKKASEQDNVEAQFWLAYCYYYGIGVDREYGLAFTLFNQSANQDSPDSMYWIARCYFEGNGVKQSDKSAFEWLKKAVGLGCVDAVLLLGDLYSQGKCVPQSHKLAFKWYEKAAQLNNVLAQHKLAEMYLLGKGADENYNKALEWEEIAAENGNEEAKKTLTRLFLGTGIGYRTGQYDGREIEINFELAFENFCKAANYGSVHAHWCIGECYQDGIGVEKNDKLAFEHFKTVLELADADISSEVSEDLRTAANLSMSKCYREGKGVEKNEELASQYFERVDNDILGNAFYDGLMHSSPKAVFAKEVLDLRLHIHNSLGEFDKATDHVNKVFENADGSENTFKKISLELIKSKMVIANKNQELEEKNRQLQEAQIELEDMMSMFAHKFRSPLDAIIYNTTHENQVKLYAEAAQTMQGLLDIFSNISTDADILIDKIKQDKQGRGGLTKMFSKTLDMILLHLMSKSGAAKIQQHYLRYAKEHGLCEPQLSCKLWNEEFFELELQLQADWEQSYAQLLIESAPLEQRLAWLEQHFFKLEIRGFDSADIHFKEYGTTESFLTILLNEILVNAFKYYSSMDKQPVVLEWIGRDDYQVLSSRNPSIRSERTMLKGSGKGHAFLSALARKTGSQFSKPKPQDDYVLEFGIANELLTANPEGEL